MFDKRTTKLLELLVQICADGSYKIVEINDLIKVMAPRFRVDATSISQIIRALSDNEMVDVKYADEKVYCISVLPKGRVADDGSRKSKRKGKGMSGLLMTLLFVGCFIAALAGAVVGTLVAGLF